VELTPEGQIFLPAARDVLISTRRAVEAAQMAARGGVGQLRLGSAGTLPNELAVRLVRAFRAAHPAVEVTLSQSSYITCPLAEVDRGDVELAVVREPIPRGGLDFVALLHERLAVAMSASHPLARRRSVTIDELRGEPIVTSAHWPQTLRDYWAGAGEGTHPGYVVAVAARGPGEWLSALAEGKGICLCPRSIAGYYRRDDLAYVQVEDLRPCATGLAWRRESDAALLRNFVECARTHASCRDLRGWTAQA
jgi:DNA-binding transcriptional LysR family regulator